MPHEIIKPSPDEDFYIDWSSITEAPCYWGTREHMAREVEPGDGKRFDRADQNGSSAMHSAGTFWGRDEIFMQQGIVPRANMRALCERIEAAGGDSSIDVSDLLTPL